MKDGLGGDYGEETYFRDVDDLLIDFMTFKALKATLAQLFETDVSPGKGEYKWLHEFVAENSPQNGQRFVRALFDAGRSDIAERIIRQRESLLKRWIKRFVKTKGEDVGVKMSRQNLELFREHVSNSVSFLEDENADDFESGVMIGEEDEDEVDEDDEDECEELELQP